MDRIFEAIEEWMRNLLTGMVSSNLTTMYTDVNEKTGQIAAQVGQTPQGWNGNIYSMIQNLSDSVIVPIAGMIITFVLCYELISMLTEKNNMHDIDTWMFFKYFFKMWVAVYLVSHTFDITMAVFYVGQHIVNAAGGVIESDTAINVMDELLGKLENAEYEITEVKKGERIKNAPLPFTTSTLQQEAAKTLNFSTQKTMRLAQQLYEGIDIKGSGTVGLISYLRTDSTRISQEADEAARTYIGEQYGENYVSTSGKMVKKDQKIQDAHEAIRPTDITRTPVMVKESLSRDQFRLYQLIWKRFTASRMSAAKYETTSVKISAGEYTFTVAASKIIFDGFMSVYMQEEDNQKGNVLSQSLEKGMKLQLTELKPEQHFTQPPAHYTEASLVKALEEQGIGRPSTYAPTITTIISRRYVSKEQKNLYVTELGEVVNNIMKQAFPSIVDVRFTAMMEGLLDCVEEGTVQWKTVVRNFYPDLKRDVDAAEKELEKVEIQDEVTDEICDVCGRNMVIKYGPHGRFLACPGFPECRNTKPYYEKIGVACPKCGKDVVLKKTQKGRKYYGCIDNPECDFMSWQKPSAKKCPVCGSYMVEKGNKIVCSETTCGYVEQKSKED